MSLDITALIAAGEGDRLEFKQSLAERDAGLADLCAMVNADEGSGTVLFGVTPEGAVCGVEPGNLDKAQRSIVQAISAGVEPSIAPHLVVLPHAGHHIVVLTASRARAIPYFEFAGVAYIRVGTVTRRLTLQEKHNLSATRSRESHPGPWRCDRCNTYVGMLMQTVITDQGVYRSFKCSCGGEFWPATR